MNYDKFIVNTAPEENINFSNSNNHGITLNSLEIRNFNQNSYKFVPCHEFLGFPNFS